MLHEAKAYTGASESCNQEATKPWNMNIEEAKATGFRLGEAFARNVAILDNMKDCLNCMKQANEFSISGRDYALAITHLEDSVTRMERAVRDLAKSFRNE